MSKNRGKCIDYKRLFLDVKAHRESLNVSRYEAADAAGISKSTYGRVENGFEVPTAEVVGALCAWMNVPVEHYIPSQKGKVSYQPDGDILNTIDAHIFADKNLLEVDKQKLSNIFRACYREITKK